MQYSSQIDTQSPILKKLTIKVPAQEVAKHFERGLVEVQRTAKIKGFRPGHVPITVVKQMYGADVRHQVFHNVIDETFRLALREHQLKAVGRPQIDTPDHKTGAGEHDHSIDENKDLTFTATVEVLPEIELKSYKGLSLTKGKVEVTDKDSELVIRGLLDSQAEVIPVTNDEQKAVMGDFVDTTFSGGMINEDGSITEKEGMKGTRVIELGSKSLIAGFEEEIVGMKKGETKTFKITFPDDYFDAELAGEQAQFTVTANELKEKKLPELNDEFAKTMGYEGVEDMKVKAREHLNREKTQEVDRKFRSDLLQLLVDKNPFDVPQALIAAQLRSLINEVTQNLKQQGYNDQMIQEALGQEIQGLQKKAENQVRASLILEAITRKEKLTLKEGDVEAEMKRMAESMKVELDRVKEFYETNPARTDDLEFKLREELAIQFVVENSKVKTE